MSSAQLPPAVLRSLEWVGVAGIDRKLGLKLLQQCAATHTGHATLAAYAQLHCEHPRNNTTFDRRG